MQRIEMAGNQAPHFIGGWYLSDPALCDAVIAWFENHQLQQAPGATGGGVNHLQKKSTDINVKPKDLTLPTNAALARYIDALYACYRDYQAQWPFLGSMLQEADIGDFNIQRYLPGEHFAAVHSERTSLASAHRVLVWMTYLNDVECGGHTHFTHQGLKVSPKRGKTLIWPAEWTHAHAGLPVVAGTKYIITGWLHFPPASLPTASPASWPRQFVGSPEVKPGTR